MEAKIIKQEKNPFLHREELMIEINSESNPTLEEVKKQVGKDENLTVVKKIDGNFGSKKYTAEVLVYEDEKSKNNVETIPQKIRKKMAEEAKKAAAEKPSEAQAETIEQPQEKPAEQTQEKTEETKPQENKE